MDPEQFRTRLKNDHRKMKRLNGSVIRVVAIGDPPQRYELCIRVRTIIGPKPAYRDESRVEIVIPAGYPQVNAEAKMLDRPPPYHPNWYRDGRWCSRDFTDPFESLAAFVVRMVKTLQFDPAITNPDSAAFETAASWWRKHVGRGLFPCDTTLLPDPEHAGIELREVTTKPRIRLLR